MTTTPITPWQRSPLVWATGCWIIGLALGRELELPAPPALIVAAVALVAAVLLVAIPRPRQPRVRLSIVIACTGLAVVCGGIAWWDVRTLDADAILLPGDGDEVGTLVEVEAVVTRPLSQRIEAAGEMGQFDYRGPGATAWVRIERWSRGSEGMVAIDPTPAVRMGEVHLLVSVPEYEDRLRTGDRVRLRGWLVPIRPPANPGERDFRQAMRERGIIGRLAVGTRANVELLETVAESQDTWLTAWRRLLERSRGSAEHALRHGLPVNLDADVEPPFADDTLAATTAPSPAAQREAEVLGLLEALLLGKRDGDMEELEEVFADTGLTHLLAISGLHLGILVAGTWWLVLITTGRPKLAVAAAVAVVGVYVLMVPARVPVLRAATMTLAAVAALGIGRRVSGMATMAAAALALLIWRPWDLFTAGFQLSFAVVAALVLYARATAQWMWPQPTLHRYGTGVATLRRYGIDYIAVSLVAWCTAMPLVAWHFGRVSPLAVLGAVAMLPFVAAMLWIGYAKVLVTALWPAVGAWMGPPLWWIGEAAVAFVRWGASWPGATMEVGSVSGWWVLSTLAVAWSAMGGRFAGRPIALTCAIAIVVGWLALGPTSGPWDTAANPGPRQVEGLRVNMLAVGHGTAIVVRSGRETWVYDCGSADHLDITTAVVGPALHAFGVRRVSTLVLSHPDLDHLSGVPELVDTFHVQRVLLTPQFIAEAESRDWSAGRFVLDSLRDSGVRIETINAGWAEPLGEARVTAIWPPADEQFEAGNDASLMLRLEVAGRRVLLSGDAQAEAMAMMLERGVDIAADVVELPHHGAWVDIGPRWIAATGADIILQSTNDRRLRHDRWADPLAHLQHFTTPRQGMLEIHIDPAGEIHRRSFRRPAEARAPE